MEAVHKPSTRAWIDDKIINVKQFLDDWMEELPPDINEFSEDKLLKSLVSEEEYLKIVKECGIDALKCEFQDKVGEPADEIVIPEGVCLDSLRYQSEHLKKKASDPKYAAAVHQSQKFANYPPQEIYSATSNESIPVVPVTRPEVILTVQVYVPVRRVDYNVQTHTRLLTFQFDQEFLVLGCQYLTELRDKIDCISDKAISGDCSDHPTDEPTTTCKDLYKSGFFYINGVFYNDMRDKDCRDYSEIIRTWAEKDRRRVGPFKSAKMEETQFFDLNIQLGYPYLYTHQGDCEHLLVFCDLRLFSEDDVSNRNAYPVYSQLKPSRRIFCMGCQIFPSTWVVYENQRLPENPFFFCKTCFFNFNYDKDNQKIGEFRAYHFPEPSN